MKGEITVLSKVQYGETILGSPRIATSMKIVKRRFSKVFSSHQLWLSLFNVFLTCRLCRTSQLNFLKYANILHFS